MSSSAPALGDVMSTLIIEDINDVLAPSHLALDLEHTTRMT